MTVSALKLHPADTVACVLRDHRAGERVQLVDGPGPVVACAVPLGHKVALRAHDRAAQVIKYGAPIGVATAPIAPGDHVHLHNLRGRMG